MLTVCAFVRVPNANFLPVRFGLGKSNQLPKNLNRYGNIKEAFDWVGLWIAGHMSSA